MHGKFFWYDIMTSDTAAAAGFYGDVVGWGTQDASTGGMDYTLFTVNGEGVAGLMSIPEEAKSHGARPCWSGYVAVDDVDGAVSKLKAQGGQVHREPIEVPGVIRFAAVADPQGAAFLVAKPLGDASPPRPAEGMPGTIGWHELYAEDWAKGFGFYQAMFGWTKDRAIDMGQMGTYQLFATGGPAVGGMMDKQPVMPRAMWGYYFNVPAIDAAVGRVTSRGGKIFNGPVEVPGGQWVVQCADPQGAPFNLVAPRR